MSYQANNLTGAYYGPAIPPSHSYPSKQRRCRCSLCCCLLSTIVSLVVAFGLFVLIVWLVLHPKVIKVAVEDAKFTNFNLNNGTLSYSLNTNISFTNPNTKIGVYYDWLQASSYYNGYRFDYTVLPTFYQSTRDTKVLNQNKTGSAVVVSDNLAEVSSQYNSDKSSGYFNIVLRIDGTKRLKIGGSASRHRKLRVRCDLSVPLETNSGSQGSKAFLRTECDVVKF